MSILLLLYGPGDMQAEPGPMPAPPEEEIRRGNVGGWRRREFRRIWQIGDELHWREQKIQQDDEEIIILQ